MRNGRVSWRLLIVVAAAAWIGGALSGELHGGDGQEANDSTKITPSGDEASRAEDQPATAPALPKGWTSEKRRVKVPTAEGEKEITYYAGMPS